MKPHQIDAEMSLPGAQQLLASTSGAHLAYISQAGTPRVMPVGFFWTGTQFVISTAATAPKVSALIANPAAALSIDGGGAPGEAQALSIRGRADITFVDGVVPEYLAAARKSMAPEAADEFERQVRRTYGRMARIAVTPHWVRYYHFGTGRVPEFLR